MTAPAPTSAPRNWLTLAAILGLVLALGGAAAWYFLRPKPEDPPKPDLMKAAHANARGIGQMEQFTYGPAIESFEEAIRFAPDWTPAKINLGIALLNTQTAENLDRALKVFAEVLEKEPENIHAHYCSGIIHYHRNQLAEAGKHFTTVTRLDPSDPHAWFYRGKCVPDESESLEALQYYKTALELNPYLNAARYSIAQHRITSENPPDKKRLLEDFSALVAAVQQDVLDIKYTEMGRYGEAIGKSPAPAPELGVMPLFETAKDFSVRFEGDTKWAPHNKLDELPKLVRARFGDGAVVLDYNRDGKLDVFLPGAVIRNGEVADVLLRNEGNNVFKDVSSETGLDKHQRSFGVSVGDFDNDGFPDLLLAGPGGLRLFRNANGKLFEDKTATAGFDKEPGVYFTAAWVDLDQDGDLDLVAAKYADTEEAALKLLKGEKVEGNGRLVVFANAGVAPPVEKDQPMGPLSCAFKPVPGPEALIVKGPVAGVVATDVDGDLDIDLLVLVDGQPPVTVFNNRLLRFDRGESVSPAPGPWRGGLVFDGNGDDQPDLVLLSGAIPEVLLSKRDDPGAKLSSRFASSALPVQLRTATLCDLDLDGRPDLVGVGMDDKPVFLKGDGTGRFSRVNSPFGPNADAVAELLTVLPADFDGDGIPDVLLWSGTTGPKLFRNLGNGNRGLTVTLSGVREKVTGQQNKYMRTNADGVGTWVRVYAGPMRAAAENTTLSAGLGQSRLPLVFGLGKLEAADAVRVRWPDGVPQAELNQAAGAITVTENNRKPSSCPILFTWDGERFVYVTDFLGAGSVGEQGPDGSVRPPRPEESVKIEPRQLASRNGKFVMKIGEPMDEVMYLDRLRLDVIDHPVGTSVFPDERFATSDPQPTQERLYFRDSDRIFATKAIDHRGRDVAATLRERDGKHVEGFALRSWLGYAEDHFVQLDFNGQLKFPAGSKVYLVLAGWTDYAFPESIYAATQAGVPTIWPVLEQKQADGTWKTLGEIGLPAGLTRVMTKDVTGWLDPAGGPLRIRTNLQIYWDQVFLAPVAAGLERSVRELPVSRATLEHRGFTQEYCPGGKLPIAYDYDRLENVAVTRWRGKLTRTGDVTELLLTDDDRHVVCGPGDEVTAEFDATGLPPLREGWQRSFVLRTWGYCKDNAPTSLTGGAVGPLPHRGMPQFPYDPVKNPLPPALAEYDRVWNTRPIGRR